MKVRAPGKLILSGEYAVLYGQPALAIAIDRYVTAQITAKTKLSHILLDLTDFAYRRYLSLTHLQRFKTRIKANYQRFITGNVPISRVLKKPFELAQFALSIMMETLNIAVPPGVRISVESDVPLGHGMGSSAATILSVMQAIALYCHMPLTAEKLLSLALQAENMQHGFSSGLDLQVILQGGCLYRHNEICEQFTLPTLPLYIVNTGAPVTSTGRCVEQVAPYFKWTTLAEEFAAVTHAMREAICQRALANVRDSIAANHHLLVRIGVVPERVQMFIQQVMLHGGAAKICGAGAVHGQQAGMVLALSEQPQLLDQLAKQFNYVVFPLTYTMRGLHAV